MNIQRLSRKEKEALYVEKGTELQQLWENPISSDDFDDLDRLTGDQLDKLLKETIDQLQFEKWWSRITGFIVSIVRVFVILGVIGLLTFGIKQIF